MRALVFFFFLLLPLFAVSQVYPGHQVMLNGGYMLAQGRDGNETVGGYLVGASYENTQFRRNVSFGAELVYLTVTDDIQLDNGPKVIEYYAVPISVFSRFYFSESAIKPYLGLGLGIHFSTATLDNFNQNMSDRGLALHLPAGLRFYIAEKLILNVEYKFYYLGSSFLGNNLAHTFNLGVGINFD